MPCGRVVSVRLARATGAEIVAAHANDSPLFLDGFPLVAGTIPTESSEVAQEWREHAHEVLEQQWCQPLVEAGVIEFASSQDGDAIDVGRRGRGGFTELVLGSFSGPRARADADGPKTRVRASSYGPKTGVRASL